MLALFAPRSPTPWLPPPPIHKPKLSWADPEIIAKIQEIQIFKEPVPEKTPDKPKVKYLGEKPVDIRKHPKFKKYKDRDWAMEFISSYGQIDGDHHKAWVLDQVARILKGTPVIVTEASWDNGEKEIRIVTGEPSMKYLEWREMMLGATYTDGPYAGEREYSYDEGIAP